MVRGDSRREDIGMVAETLRKNASVLRTMGVGWRKPLLVLVRLLRRAVVHVLVVDGPNQRSLCLLLSTLPRADWGALFSKIVVFVTGRSVTDPRTSGLETEVTSFDICDISVLNERL